MNAGELKSHIDDVCEREGITVVPHSRGGRAWRRIRKIAIRSVKSEITYAIALHEIGHILGPMQSRCRLEAEAGAWLWARENAIYWTPNMTCKMRELLGSYVKCDLDAGEVSKPRSPPMSDDLAEQLGEALKLLWVELRDSGNLLRSRDFGWPKAVDAAEAALKAYEERKSLTAPTPVDWQPIETAPKDGTEVLLWGPMCRYMNTPFSASWDADEDGFESWMVHDGKHGPFRARGNSPTHWRPLPNPPAMSRPKPQ